MCLCDSCDQFCVCCDMCCSGHFWCQGIKASRCQGFIEVSRFAISFVCVVTTLADRSLSFAQVAFGVKVSGCVAIDAPCSPNIKECRTTGASGNG
jgi:hypothetical protein